MFGDCETGIGPDETINKKLVRAQQFKDLLFSNQHASMDEIAAHFDVSKGDVSKQIRLAFLAPEITQSLLDGTGPTGLTADRLRRLSQLPTCWQTQRNLLSDG